MLNVELLNKTMTYIKDHPESWDQAYWIINNYCGTVGCFAGWACMLSGADIKIPQKNAYYGTIQVNGTTRNVQDFAREVLGLDSAKSGALFCSDNSMEDLERMVKHLNDHPDANYVELINLRSQRSSSSLLYY